MAARCVPRGAVPAMLASIQETAARHDVVIANIAHAGDGNLHPLIIAPEGDLETKALPGAEIELGPRVRQMHRVVKDALDPEHILNPGKAFS
ncbi:FAD-linked oxidase C-terminal domain-containing protein [Cryobacterium sp. SO2]|uniref:FAD-binding oxidoreductase n=1 Tax=Cryobacterium sp. SO2 TaxID=1897060 RepID=UPI00223CD2DA|nr:FAD-linked oxidase C-terminal domain-containing protein [Cryobacterium sp. SO2]WEO78793.1 FAD-linked oxidase C-terminal domain-containing protein [Cryobacterium sp. SO2]